MLMGDDSSALVSHLRVTLIFYHHYVKHRNNKPNFVLNKISFTNSSASAYWAIILPDLKSGCYLGFAQPPPSPNPFLVTKFYCFSVEHVSFICCFLSTVHYCLCLTSAPPHLLDNSSRFPTSLPPSSFFPLQSIWSSINRILCFKFCFYFVIL